MDQTNVLEQLPEIAHSQTFEEMCQKTGSATHNWFQMSHSPNWMVHLLIWGANM
jgi:hypothetical protein